MSLETLKFISAITMWSIVILTPVVVLSWKRDGQYDRVSWKRLAASVAIGWFFLVIHRSLYASTVAARLAEQRGDLYYDPVGGNAAILVAGWIPVLVSTLVVALLILVAGRFWRGRVQPSSGEERQGAAPSCRT